MNVSNAQTNGSNNVLFVNPGYEDRGFWRDVSLTMQAAATDLDINLEIVYGNRGWPLMVKRGIQAIEEKDYDYLILVNEHQQAPKLIQLAAQKNIPTLLLLNSLTEDQEKFWGGARNKQANWIGSITPDNKKAGYEMMQSMAHQLEERGFDLKSDGAPEVSLLTLAGDFKTPASLQRLKGLDLCLKEFPALSEIRRITTNWSGEEAYARTKRLLASQNMIKAIWAANDSTALGAIKAMQEHGFQPGHDFVIAGLNWSTDAVMHVDNGTMTLTHGGHFLAGAWSMILLYDYMHGKDFAEINTHIHFPMMAITPENVSRFKPLLTMQDWSKIDFKKFSRHENPELDAYPFNAEFLLRNIQP